MTTKVPVTEPSEELLRTIVEQNPSVIMITDRHGLLTYVNQRFVDVTGYTSEEVMGCNPSLLKASDDAGVDYPRLWDTLLAGEVWTGEFHNQRKDGSSFWASASIRGVRGNDGEFSHFVGMQEEISRQKRDELRFRNLLDSAPDAMVIVDEDGVIRLVNTQLEELFGYFKEELVGEAVEKLLPPAQRGAHVHQRQEYSASPRPRSMGYGRQLSGIAKDGREVPVEISLSPIEMAEGTWVAAGLRDISSRLKFEEEREAQKLEISRSQATLKALFSALPVGTVLISKTGAILEANRISEEILGLSADEHRMRSLQSQSWEILRPDGSIMPVEEYPASRVLGGESVVTGVIMGAKRPAGDIVWLSTSAAAMPESVGGCAVAFEDISEKKLANEKTLRLLEEVGKAREIAEAATRAKSDFLANMSHEIRTPMNAVIGMTHLALGTELSKQQRDYLTKSRAAAEHLLAIINDILDLSKIEAGKLGFELIDFSLEEVLARVTSVIGLKAQEKSLEFLLNVGAQVPRSLKGDPLRLGQVLMNLASNAVKFTSKGEVEIGVQLIDQQDSDVELEFRVRDTGLGLSEAQIDTLFESFQQADASTTRKFGGTGLGLSISKHLVEGMKGSIEIDSTPGEGSTFRFNAHFLGVSHQTLIPAMDQRSLSGARVLIVDDNDSSRVILGEMIETMGLDITLASSGREAMDLLNQVENKFELVLLDWMMPELDGVETARRIRLLDGEKQPSSVIMVTAYDSSELAVKAKTEGVSQILTKPVNPSTMLDAIMMALAPSERVHPDAESAPLSADLKGLRILLVEDNEINRQVARELLEQVGAEVTLANDGIEAVEKASPKLHDLVLMDCQMPRMDGYEATRVLRTRFDAQELPIIAMTANALEGDRAAVLEAGMQDHIAKPVDPPIVFATIAKWSPGQRMANDSDTEIKTKPFTEGTDSSAPDDTQVIDFRGALARVAGNTGLLVKLASEFATKEGDAFERIAAHLEVGEREPALLIAHTLKGLSSTLGALKISALAATQEVSLREGLSAEQYRASVAGISLPDLISEYRAELAQRGLVPQVSVKQRGPSTFTPQSHPAFFEKLARLLDEGDTDALVLLEEFLAGDDFKELQPPPELEKVLRIAQDYDFQGALEALCSWTQES